MSNRYLKPQLFAYGGAIKLARKRRKKGIVMKIVALFAALFMFSGCTYNPNGASFDQDRYECRHGIDHEHPQDFDTEHYYKCMEARGWQGRPVGDQLIHSLFD